MKKVAIINTQSPFNTPTARESLDLALIFGAFEQQVTVIFLADGVYQLLQPQTPEHIEGKDFLATMKAFALYDIEHIVCCAEDMERRGVSPDALVLATQILAINEIAELLRTFDQVVTL